MSVGVTSSTSQTDTVDSFILSQALVNPAISRHVIPEVPSNKLSSYFTSSGNASTSLSLTHSQPSRILESTLTIYYYSHHHYDHDATLDNSEPPPTSSMPRTPPALLATSSPSSDLKLTVTLKKSTSSIPMIRILPTKYRSSATVFKVDISALSSIDGLVISCDTTPAPIPTTTKSSKTTPMCFDWTPENGYHVIIASTFPRLLTPAEAYIRLYYHRFDAFSDSRRWRLRLSHDESDIGVVVLRAHGPHREGVVFFDVTATQFPYGAVVKAELYRVSSSSPTVNVPTTKGDYQISVEVETAASPVREVLDSIKDEEVDEILSSLKVDRRDVVREWRSGKTGAEVHIVQGDDVVRSEPPERESVKCARKMRVRYRRFLPNDYEGWDLWTWDDADAAEHRVAVKGVCDDSGAWIDFILDRAEYGAGQHISLLPRRGGSKWTEQDYPVRVANVRELLSNFVVSAAVNSNGVDDGGMKTVLIAQGALMVFTDLINNVKGMMDVYVESVSSVIIQTPVPIAWVSPPKRGRPKAVSATLHRLCDDNADLQHLLQIKDDEEMTRSNVKGRDLQFKKVQEVSATEMRLRFNGNVFDEDFLVERVVVRVPGFNARVLHWRRQENWDDYLYDGELGWEYERRQCKFRCFAPTADKVSVVLYTKYEGEEGRKAISMRRIPQGCWKVIVEGDLKGMYYKLLAEGENKRLFPGVECIDPYSRCNTAHAGRGFIFGKEETNIAPRPNIKPNEAIVYELHIRDITIDDASGISKRGKFEGLCERGTHMDSGRLVDGTKQTGFNYTTHENDRQDVLYGVDKSFQKLDKLSTGLDHIAQMGVNTVQILPIQDFDNDEHDDKSYRWGYMPVHFNSPDGWYASCTTDASRVSEFKKLVDAIHKAGMKVIMDVVYNHTAEDSNEFNVDARFSFNALVPRYYYRTCGNTPVAHTGDSTCARRRPDEARCGECYSNGSGCGNEFRSEAPMGRKFIIDSLKLWVNQYKVDGFRFDLMGLIDVDTMVRAAAELHAIDENILLYGEPWAGGLSPIRLTEKGMQRSKGFGVFNNTFRDAIRGSPFESEETFVMDGGRLTDVKGGIIGSVDVFCDTPVETMNYVECHDNYTLWDHFLFYVRSRMDDIQFSQDDLRRMHRLAAVLVLTSQGVAFIQAGQEMCRTKFDVENSYESPDEINMIRWERKIEEWTTVQYYRGLTLLRRSHPEIFCKETAKEIHESVIFYEDLGLVVPIRCIAYHVKGNPVALFEKLKEKRQDRSFDEIQEESLKWTEVVVLLNPTPSQVTFQLPGAADNCIWLQVVDTRQAGVGNLRGPAIGYVSVEGRSAAVLRKASKKDTFDAQLSLRLDAVSDSYCSYQGDDALCRYAVGLNRVPSVQEAVEQRELREERRKFQKYQDTLKSIEQGSTES